MSARRNLVEETARRAQRQLTDIVRDLRIARENACLSQGSVADAIRVSHQLISVWERGLVIPDSIQLARWGAVVGLDVVVRAYPGGSPLRDAAQLKLIRRLRQSVGEGWTWRTEVPVSGDQLDRRAFDVVLNRGEIRVGVEAISRLVDAQSQVRTISLKQETAGLECVIIVLADTRHNRAALRDAEPTLRPAFPLDSRAVLGALRAGEMPPANGVVLA